MAWRPVVPAEPPPSATDPVANLVSLQNAIIENRIDGAAQLISLPLLGNRELRWAYEDQALDAGYEADPQDPLVLLGLGHRSFQEKDFQTCEKRLRPAIHVDPTLWEARVRLAKVLFESGRNSKLVDWLGQLDAAAL